MSEADLGLVRSMYAGFSELAGGADVASYVSAHYTDEIEYLPVDEGAAVRGQQALIKWNERWFEPWEEFRAEVEELRELDGTILARVRVSGRGGESGMEVGQRIFHLIELRDGRIARMREFTDEAEAVKAAAEQE
jgi:ketosteroid isomerase-like protein